MSILRLLLRAILIAVTSFLGSRATEASAEEVKSQQGDGGGLRG